MPEMIASIAPDLKTLLIIMGVLMTASFIQGAVGFAFGLFALPMLAFIGVSPMIMVALLSTTGSIQLMTSLSKVRSHINFREVTKPIIIRAISIPLGVYLLHLSQNLGKEDIQQAVGVLILVIIAIQLVFSAQPRDSIHPHWGTLAFSLSGITQGMASLGGPTLVLWVIAHNWSNQRIRAYLFAAMLGSSPFQFAFLFYAFGTSIMPAIVLGLIAAPAVIAGAWLGVKAGHGLSASRLRSIAMVILSIIAVISIAKPYL
ncbi:sulfite exporter TauE/SafE family protein [Kiloniella sp. b19]|uniref:sulfite exporter TauE/SafE family protein n=1 Tax=Kiloniella sp. GXU_MW_B19 TaxID=3141326 RepID=UPI0031D54922